MGTVTRERSLPEARSKDSANGLAYYYDEAQPRYPEELFSYLRAIDYSDGDFVDLGAGTGIAPESAYVTAVDISEEMVAVGRKKQNYILIAARK